VARILNFSMVSECERMRAHSAKARGKGFAVRSFLSSNAIRGRNSMDEPTLTFAQALIRRHVCFSRSPCPCLPRLIRPPSKSNRDVKINYLHAKRADKDFIVVEGANTGVTPCTNCAILLGPMPMLRISSIMQQNGSTTGFHPPNSLTRGGAFTLLRQARDCRQSSF
jgi:hypothetical protein